MDVFLVFHYIHYAKKQCIYLHIHCHWNRFYSVTTAGGDSSPGWHWCC